MTTSPRVSACKQLVLCACLLIAPRVASAQEPLPALPDDTPAENAPPPTTFGPSQPQAGVASVDPEMARRVAQDAYLGGMGVLGPIPLVAVVSWVAPVIGGVAAAWSLEQAEPDHSGRWMESVVAAFTASLVRDVGTRAFGAMVTPIILLLEVPPLLAWAGGLAAALALYAAGYSVRSTVLGAYMAGIGASLVLLAPALLVATLLFPLTTMFTRWVAVAAADLVWDRIALRKGQPRRDTLLTARIPEERPMDTLLTAGLIAASVSGRWERSAFFEHLPIVGPWLAVGDARVPMATRVSEARQVAGWSEGGNPQLIVDALLFSRAALLTFSTAVFLSLPMALVGVGGATLAASALAFAGASDQTIVSAVLGLGVLYTGLAVVIVAAGALGTVALVGAGLLQDVIPWLLGGVAVWGERAPSSEATP